MKSSIFQRTSVAMTRQRWHSLPSTTPPTLQASNSLSTAAALNSNRRSADASQGSRHRPAYFPTMSPVG